MLPTAAVLAVLAVERAGHTIRLNETGDQILVEQAPGVPLDDHDLAQLRKWKQHALLFMRYIPPEVH